MVGQFCGLSLTAVPLYVEPASAAAFLFFSCTERSHSVPPTLVNFFLLHFYQINSFVECLTFSAEMVIPAC